MNPINIVGTLMDVDHPKTAKEKAIESIDSRLQTYELEIQGLLQEYDEVMATEGTGIARDKAIEIINTKTDEVTLRAKNLRLTRDLLLAEERQKEKRKTEEKIQAARAKLDINKHIDSLMNSKPRDIVFNSTSNDCEGFIKKFVEFSSDILPTKEDRQEYLWGLFRRIIKDDNRHGAFFAKLTAENVPKDDIIKLKEYFLNFYLGRNWQGGQLGQIATVAMGKEQPSSYVARIQQKCQSMGIDMTTCGDAGFKFLKQSWFYNLPTNEQNTLYPKMTTILKDGSIRDFLDLVLSEIPQMPSRIEKAKLCCPYCSDNVEYSCGCTTGRIFRNKPNNNSANFKGVNPRGANGFNKRNQENENSIDAPAKRRKTDEETKTLKAKGLCFKCEKTWKPGHSCSLNKTEEKPFVAAMCVEIDIPPVDENPIDTMLDIDGVVSTSMTPNQQADSRRTKCALTLDGHLVHGLHIDTMADHTILRAGLLTKIYLNYLGISLG